MQSGRAKIEGALTATNASVANGVVFGKKAAATVDVYEDFQCPHCLRLREGRRQATRRRRPGEQGAGALPHRCRSWTRPRTATGTPRGRPTRRCARPTSSVDDFVAFHNVLYGTISGKQVQPAEGSHGRIEHQAGVLRPGGGAQRGGADHVRRVRAERGPQGAGRRRSPSGPRPDGVNGTPTIKVNGKTISPTLAAWNKAIAAALMKGPAPVPSKTPTPDAVRVVRLVTTPTTKASPTTSALAEEVRLDDERPGPSLEREGPGLRRAAGATCCWRRPSGRCRR